MTSIYLSDNFFWFKFSDSKRNVSFYITFGSIGKTKKKMKIYLSCISLYQRFRLSALSSGTFSLLHEVYELKKLLSCFICIFILLFNLNLNIFWYSLQRSMAQMTSGFYLSLFRQMLLSLCLSYFTIAVVLSHCQHFCF